MAFSYTGSFGTMIIPDSAVVTNVISNPTGISTAGVVTIVGEADEGPSWSQDQAAGNKLANNTYGTQDIAAVIKKYGSGRLVDAYKGITSPSASTRIVGGPQRVILCKTNNSNPSFYTTRDQNGTFQADRSGALGNQVQVSVISSTPEQAPTTGNFSYIPSAAAATAIFEVNGTAPQSLPIPANTLPSTLASSIMSLTNLNVVGGVNRNILSGLTGKTLQVVASGQNVTITLQSPFVFASRSEE